MTDFLKIAKSIVVHFAHICAYGVETVKHHFPNKGYNFPVHNLGDHNRKFRNKWLDEFKGAVAHGDYFFFKPA